MTEFEALQQRRQRSSWWLPLQVLYGAYAFSIFLVVALLALACILLLPKLAWRRAAARNAARTSLFLIGMPVAVRGTSLIPDGQCVVVANHASYLDGVVFTAVLPPRFGFVIKREMDAVPLAGLLLRRIGSEFVDRNNHNKSARDARRVLRSATNGHSLVFFPEGTFSDGPGLLKFHTGAFAIAARARCPVVPAVIRGTRHALPSTRWLPLPGRIVVEFLAPLTPDLSAGEELAIALRDRSRQRILEELGEPDLSNAA
ncbi:MAG: 1-acyl-sn-glycerol-3-phosphate acyltransferase [Pseudomonadales bacterium]|nr:1-acyl-sn-glycerol-3-phosphate acyltransferase [Pseudomonadales bacterium]